MKKISTLFKKDPNDLGKVINEINPENQWVFDGEEIDNPATHTRCKCGITYYHLDENPCLACECEFYQEYQRHRFGDEDDFEHSDSTDR